MTLQEFSNEFDVLWNSVAASPAPMLDEYEKSVFLTQAQNDILKHYFNPLLNKTQAGFDGTPRRDIDFSMVLKTVSYKNSDDFKQTILDNRLNSKRVSLGDDVMMVINEFVDVNRGETGLRLTVVPITYPDYNRFMSKPFKRPANYQAWRLIDGTNGSHDSELIVGPSDEITNYTVRYVKRPQAIILCDLEPGVSLDGKTAAQECELDPILHPEILQRGIELAKAVYMGDLNSSILLGQTSQTEVGAVQQQPSR